MKRFCVAAIVLCSACVAPRAPALDATPSDAPRLVGTAEGLRTPESARYDPEQDLYFVSQIDGVPSWKDGRGAIARIDPDGLHTPELDFIRSGARGVRLDAPTGLAIAGDTLWVADVDALRGFDRRTGQPVTTVDLAPYGARYLNDLAVGPDGMLYVTDTGLRISSDTSVTHPGPDRIFRVAGLGESRYAVSVVAAGDTLAQPNGLTWDERDRRWLLAPLGSRSVFSWQVEQLPVPLATGPGAYDGIEVLPDGRVLVTSWADSSVSEVTPDGRLRRLITGVEGPADLGVDTKRRRVLVPMFNSGKLAVYALP